MIVYRLKNPGSFENFSDCHLLFSDLCAAVELAQVDEVYKDEKEQLTSIKLEFFHYRVSNYSYRVSHSTVIRGVVYDSYY